MLGDLKWFAEVSDASHVVMSVQGHDKLLQIQDFSF